MEQDVKGREKGCMTDEERKVRWRRIGWYRERYRGLSR